MFNPDDLDRHYRYCWSLTGSEAEAFDLLQSGLEKVLRNPPHEHGARHAYLRRTLHNLFVDQARHRKLLETESLEEACVADVSTGTLEEIAIAQLDFVRIWRELSAMEREVLHYWAIEGYTAREIAEELEIPRGTVLSRVHRVRRRLQDELRDQQEVPA